MKAENSKYLVQYVKTKRGPKGVIIALNKGRGFSLGWSLCKKGDQFSKSRAIEIALGRANKGVGEVNVPPSLTEKLEAMKKRAQRYFRCAN
ncbi:hypothetical protein D6827_02900 [Candidatus Parcubacteria bacterium]|nr:MAG: hypothetical protein D6827_02900 [Candidatus Parcubacteria bacterium]